MDLKTELNDRLNQALKNLFTDEGIEESIPEIVVEKPRNPEHGDYATNAAMLCARTLKRNPMQIAEDILRHFDGAGLVRESSVAKPGFINFRIATEATASVVHRILEAGADFGRTEGGKGRRVLVEFVSANPTGPLHIGHARGAVVGDVLSRLLTAAGYDVRREYYFNDAGVQMDMLGRTLRLRVEEQLGRSVEWPETYYRGDYMIEIARRMIDELGAEEAGGEHPTKFYTDYAVREVLKMIDADLKEMGIDFDSWFSETTLHENGEVEATLRELRDLGRVYEFEGAEWLRTTDYGDEKDRVVVKSDGHYTYLAPDIAYHRDKYGRGFDRLINVLGADHHGYIPRLRAAVAALGHPYEALQCVIVQMVSLLKGGETMKLSTRSGEFITLKEMIEELGVGVVRFFFAMRSPDTQMVFDWELARDTSMDNPVYYVQYAHARCCSLFKKAKDLDLAYEGPARDLSALEHESEKRIIQTLGRFPEVAAQAAEDLAPQNLTNYLQETAQLFHNFFTQGNVDPSLRFVIPDDPELTRARLTMIDALRTVLSNGLGMLGIEAMERM